MIRILSRNTVSDLFPTIFNQPFLFSQLRPIPASLDMQVVMLFYSSCTRMTIDSGLENSMVKPKQINNHVRFKILIECICSSINNKQQKITSAVLPIPIRFIFLFEIFNIAKCVYEGIFGFTDNDVDVVDRKSVV